MQETRRVKHDLVTSIIMIIISTIALWKTRGLSEMSYVFPRTVGIILLVLSVIYFVVSLIRREDKKLFENIEKQKVLIMCAGMIGYVALIGFFGFLIASIVYIGVLSWYLQRDEKEKTSKVKLIHSGITALSVSIFFFALFRYVFLVPLPPGLLFGG